MKPKKEKEKAPSATYVPVAVDLGNAANSMRAVASHLESVLVDRKLAIEALMLCWLTRQHLMLEGVHGTAKSMLAVEASKCVSGDFTFFQKQLMKGTSTDELFGPMNSKVYREEARWEHNLENFLPSAHFAFLDEVYRGSDSVLGSIMGILNEKVFMNGTDRHVCPLITAIGTTNFTTETEELAAFHDRWLIRMKIEPLGSTNLRLRLLERFLEREALTEEAESPAVELSDLFVMQEAVRSMKISAETVPLYEELVSTYNRQVGKTFYISDRRLCASLPLAKAYMLMMEGDPDMELTPDYLGAVKYGLIQSGNREQTQAFDSAFGSVIGDYEKTRVDREKTNKFQRVVENLSRQYDSSMGKEKAKLLYSKVQQVYKAVTTAAPDEMPADPRCAAKMQECTKNLSSLLQSLTGLVV